MKTLLLSKNEVGTLVDLDKMIEAVENGYKAFNSGKVVQPDFMNLVEPGTHKGFDFKACLDMGSGLFSMKSSSGGYTDNPALGLPTGMNTVFLYDAKTSALKCIMDGSYIRDLRTAAAAAISIKYLARKNAAKYFAYGAGRIGKAALRMTSRVRNLTDVYVFGYLEGENERYIEELKKDFPNYTYHSVSTPEEGARQADIIVSVTLARKGPVIKKEWLKPGTHVTAIGADGPDKQELYPDVLQGTKVVNDSIALCVKNGETYHAVTEGLIKPEDIYGEIGEIALGKKPGRENDEEITVFDTVGMGIQDTSAALMFYNAAVEKGLGTYYEFI